MSNALRSHSLRAPANPIISGQNLSSVHGCPSLAYAVWDGLVCLAVAIPRKNREMEAVSCDVRLMLVCPEADPAPDAGLTLP
jgi:hypothetical protein